MNIPKGHQPIMPYLIMDGAAAFLEFVKIVFPVQVTYESRNDDGTIGHCEIQIHGSTIMFSNTTQNWTPRTADMFVYVENADTSFDKAVSAGGKVVMPLEDKDYGRSGGIRDPFGNIWWITSVK